MAHPKKKIAQLKKDGADWVKAMSAKAPGMGGAADEHLSNFFDNIDEYDDLDNDFQNHKDVFEDTYQDPDKGFFPESEPDPRAADAGPWEPEPDANPKQTGEKRAPSPFDLQEDYDTHLAGFGDEEYDPDDTGREFPMRVLRRSLEFQVRSIDAPSRSATFVASTERPVKVGPWEPEVLRMSGCNLKRYLRNPVLLDTHKREGLDSVIGSCQVRIKGRQLIATATYARTKKGEDAWLLVQDGHVRAMSIGYDVNPERVRKIRSGETDGEGDSLINGPASIVDDWSLLEVSNVPVPADEDAVRRSFYDAIERRNMAKIKGRRTDSLAPAGKTGDEELAQETKADVNTMLCPHCGKEVPIPAGRVADEGETMPGSAEPPRAMGDNDGDECPPGKKSKAGVMIRMLPDEEKKRAVMARCPKGLEHIAERGLLEGKDRSVIIQELLKAHTNRMSPIGTTEPRHETRGNRGPSPEELDDDALARSLEGLTS